MEQKRKLRNLLIFPESQVRYGILFLALATFTHVSLTLGVLKIYSTWITADEDVPTFALWFAIVAMLAVYFILQAFAFALGILMSHKLFGPIVAFKSFVRELKQGNYSARITLRVHDEQTLRELASEFNELAEQLAKK
jgi:nitrogen fixation/metabolism regulation signal transduction histidine kinase